MTNHQKNVIEANIVYHSAIAETYEATQPHFKPENVARVDRVLAALAAPTRGGCLLDLGCGTGFVIDIAKKHFWKVVGVDITPAMLEQVDISIGMIELHHADTADLPFPDDEFDACSAYSFLHHLDDLRPTLAEAFRCLRLGGRFYSDQDPNYYYWQLMNALKTNSDLDGIVKGEVESVVFLSKDIAAETGLSPRVVSGAEVLGDENGGVDAEAIVTLMREIGFRSVRYRYEWFLGQGKVLHQQPAMDVQVIEKFLREALPATRHLFKYVSIYAEK